MDKSSVRIAAPCTVDWRKMTPADGGRFCGDCKKVVRDLSRMSEDDAQALLAANRGDLCVRFLYDRHGKIFFAGDRATPLVPASLLSRARRATLAAAAIALPLAMNGCSSPLEASGHSSTNQEQRHDEELTPMMGGAPYDPSNDWPADAGSDAETDGSPDASADGATDGGVEPDANEEPIPDGPL